MCYGVFHEKIMPFTCKSIVSAFFSWGVDCFVLNIYRYSKLGNFCNFMSSTTKAKSTFTFSNTFQEPFNNNKKNLRQGRHNVSSVSSARYGIQSRKCQQVLKILAGRQQKSIDKPKIKANSIFFMQRVIPLCRWVIEINKLLFIQVFESRSR